MYTPSAKKIRLDCANETLRKPFKSPALRRGAPETVGGTTSPRTQAVPATTNSESTQTSGITTAVTTKLRGEPHLTPFRQEQQLKTPTRHRPFSLSRPQQHGIPLSSPFTNPVATKSTGDTTPNEIRSARELEGREEIIRQAQRIRGRPSGAETDAELVELIGKWRSASRLAAEEVFEASRERVISMGGMKAWRKMRREEQKSFAERMMEEKEQQPRRDHDVDDSAGGVGAENGADEDEGDDDEDEDFTMGTMLRSMNIDFDVIGYDEDSRWWKDG